MYVYKPFKQKVNKYYILKSKISYNYIFILQDRAEEEIDIIIVLLGLHLHKDGALYNQSNIFTAEILYFRDISSNLN